MQKCIFVAIQLEDTASQEQLTRHCNRLRERSTELGKQINQNRRDENLVELPVITFCDVRVEDGRIRVEAGCFKF